ncbi:hypothetical protein B0H11DRAFT_201196 [Mycena galericulata]|nr:hypothetical protein B0H11DRAFT_201196 [Mycena galericulata]
MNPMPLALVSVFAPLSKFANAKHSEDLTPNTWTPMALRSPLSFLYVPLSLLILVSQDLFSSAHPFKLRVAIECDRHPCSSLRLELRRMCAGAGKRPHPHRLLLYRPRHDRRQMRRDLFLYLR